jgi:hypothetical protein
MISDNLTTLNGKSVRDFDAQTGIGNLESTVYRLRVDYDAYEDGKNIPDMIGDFTKDVNAGQVEELIIGAFDFEGGNTSEIAQALVDAAPKLPKLKSLFIGDITYEEYEISWINQCDLSAVLRAYPALEYFRVRGGNELSLGKSLQHTGLRHLIIETGGLPPSVITELASATLPNLEHLELWLGSEDYGFGSEVSDFDFVFQGSNFPKLRYLGLRDSVIADDLAKALSTAPIVNQLDVLDLSMGTLGDDGANALLQSSTIGKLKLLDLHYHFISEEVSRQLQKLGIAVNLKDRQEGDEGDRYIQVAE